MSVTRIALVGAGEHGRVVVEAALTRPDAYAVLGFFDPKPCEETVRRFGIPRLGSEPAPGAHPDLLGVVGVGAVGVSRVRAGVVSRLDSAVSGWATVVHARAWVAPSAEVGEGSVVLAGALVNSGARIGRHVIVNTGAIIEHDVVLGDFVQVSPGAVIAGGTRVGPGTYVGLGAAVRDHLTIGADALVAMGAVVVSDVPDGASVRGVPAR